MFAKPRSSQLPRPLPLTFGAREAGGHRGIRRPTLATPVVSIRRPPLWSLLFIALGLRLRDAEALRGGSGRFFDAAHQSIRSTSPTAPASLEGDTHTAAASGEAAGGGNGLPGEQAAAGLADAGIFGGGLAASLRGLGAGVGRGAFDAAGAGAYGKPVDFADCAGGGDGRVYASPNNVAEISSVNGGDAVGAHMDASHDTKVGEGVASALVPPPVVDADGTAVEGEGRTVEVSRGVKANAESSRSHDGHDAHAGNGQPLAPAPIIWVPGITSSPLQAYYNSSRGPLKNRWCHGVVPKDTWYTLYLSTTLAARSPVCYMWQLQLRPPENPGGCVRDAEGLEIREIGFGETFAASTINPSDPISVRLYEKMIQELEKAGWVRDQTIRFAQYDWRKFGDKCWEREWYPRLKKLIEETSERAGTSVILGCHSMGCTVIVAFLDSEYVDTSWKHRYVKEFLAVGPVLSGSSMLMLNFIQGPTYDYVPLMFSHSARDVCASMPGGYTLMPLKGLDGWDEEMTIIETPWRNYTIGAIYDGSFYSDVEGPEGLDLDAAVGAGAGAAGVAEQADGGEQTDPQDDMVILTEQGCVCRTSCSYSGEDWEMIDIPSLVDGLPRPWSQRLLRPYCSTLGQCGRWNLMNGYWDYCSGSDTPSDAGPGFEFYPLVDAPPSAKYERFESAQVEELKEKCLADPQCSAFSSDMWLVNGSTRSDKLVGAYKGEGLFYPGLFVKRTRIQRCQAAVNVAAATRAAAGGAGDAVCGSDGRTYSSKRALELAQCWRQPPPTKVSDGVCPSELTRQGCVCDGECSTQRSPGDIDGHKAVNWCFTKGRCGNPFFHLSDSALGFKATEGLKALFWDFCTKERRRLDTGRGFEYLPATAVDASMELRVMPEASFSSLEAMQVACGEDPDCAGFTTEGLMMSLVEGGYDDEQNSGGHGLLDFIKDATDSRRGVYLKLSRVVRCQQTLPGCDPARREERHTVCVVERRRTFPAPCAADSALCYYDAWTNGSLAPLNPAVASALGPASPTSTPLAAAAVSALALRTKRAERGDGAAAEAPATQRRYIDGPCKRQMRTNLHSFAVDWVRRASNFKPPGVPTTCFFIEDVPTDTTWYVDDFLLKGTTTSWHDGDGTVTAKSVRGPCELWQRSQDAPVRLSPQSFGGRIAHVTMIQSSACVAALLEQMTAAWPEAEAWAQAVWNASAHVAASEVISLATSEVATAETAEPLPSPIATVDPVAA